MTCLRDGLRSFLLIVLLLILPVSCGKRGLPVVHQSLESQQAQAAYGRYVRMLDDSISCTFDWLERDQRQHRLFALNGDQAEQCNAYKSGTTPWHEATVTFLVAPPSAQADSADQTTSQLHQGVWLFNPRYEQLEQVAQPGVGAEVTVYRALPVASMPMTDDRLRIFVHRFSIDAEGAIHHSDGERLSDGPGNDLLPVLMSEHESVIFQREQDQQLAQLMQLNLKDGSIRPLFSDTRALRSARLPLRLKDGQLGFVGQEKADKHLLALDLESGVVSELDPAAIDHGMPGSLFATAASKEGPIPVLLHLPEELSVAQVMALARARSPAAARYRALLAVALAESRREALSLWPSFSVGLAYTPAVGLLTDAGGGSSGDFLGEHLVRMLGGMVQPLFNANRAGALEEAALERARIAADLSIAAATRSAVSAATTALDLQRIDEQLQVARQSEEAAHKHTQRMGQRRDQGQANNAVVLAAEAAWTEAKGRLALLHKQRAQRHAALSRQLGLHPELEIRIRRPEHDLVGLAMQPRQHLQRLAAIRQPRLRAAAHEAKQAFLVAKADRRHQASLFAGANYGYTMNAESGSEVDDYLTLSLSGQLPLAAGRDRRLAADSRRAIRLAREAALVEERAQVADEVDRHWLALNEAANTARVLAAQVNVAEEELRVARLRSEEPIEEDGTSLELVAIAQKERTLASLRHRYLEERNQAAIQALRLLGVTGSDQLLESPLNGGKKLIKRIRHERLIFSDANPAAIRALGPPDSATRRTLVIDLTDIDSSHERLCEDILHCLAAADIEDEVVLQLNNRKTLRWVNKRIAAVSPLERRFDSASLLSPASGQQMITATLRQSEQEHEQAQEQVHHENPIP